MHAWSTRSQIGGERVDSDRQARIERRTKETEITLTLNLDGQGQAEVSTGVGFLDHMLTSLSSHSRFDLELSARGDLHVDSHHLVEDVAICLGQAVKESLGSRQGIERFGHAVVPMDESLAAATVDCSGRGHAAISIEFVPGSVGGLPTSLLEHFFESFARSAELTLHLAATGSDNHHVAEASFKALARALRQATRTDPSLRGLSASTKGSL